MTLNEKLQALESNIQEQLDTSSEQEAHSKNLIEVAKEHAASLENTAAPHADTEAEEHGTGTDPDNRTGKTK